MTSQSQARSSVSQRQARPLAHLIPHPATLPPTSLLPYCSAQGHRGLLASLRRSLVHWGAVLLLAAMHHEHMSVPLVAALDM